VLIYRLIDFCHWAAGFSQDHHNAAIMQDVFFGKHAAKPWVLTAFREQAP
jgi:hypothetical protein